MNASPRIERIAAWERYPWLIAGFSTRQGGVSRAYGEGEFNLGWTVEDDPRAVAENRRRLVCDLSGDTERTLVTLRQVHGHAIRTVTSQQAPFATSDGRSVLEGDGSITAERGLLLGIQTADCVPVLVADTDRRVVAAFHAGWRGTLAGIVGHGIAAMQSQFQSDPADLVAAIGPAILPCCFVVGDEVQAAFRARYSYSTELFVERLVAQERPGLALDLQRANRRQLLDAGLRTEAISVLAQCTACTRLADGTRRYFSHRAERGVTGRMMSVIGIAG